VTAPQILMLSDSGAGAGAVDDGAFVGLRVFRRRHARLDRRPLTVRSFACVANPSRRYFPRAISFQTVAILPLSSQTRENRGRVIMQTRVANILDMTRNSVQRTFRVSL
jgi:hypothetical protein